jgi:hypothetical protein
MSQVRSTDLKGLGIQVNTLTSHLQLQLQFKFQNLYSIACFFCIVCSFKNHVVSLLSAETCRALNIDLAWAFKREFLDGRTSRLTYRADLVLSISSRSPRSLRWH